MPQGGTVTIRAHSTEEGLFVSVSDTGGGISSENLAHVMEPLFTTKARGIGLGLAMARAIVEKHLGRIIVASPPGAGATFTVQLPCGTA
jgi:two-component system NtrC family sensor kinase